MLSLLPPEILQIDPVLRLVHPEAETGQLGSWGILYTVCGAALGQAEEWKARVAQNEERRSNALLELVTGNPSEIDIAFSFADLMLGWSEDPAGRTLARKRLADLERSRGMSLLKNEEEQFTDYFGLAIMLNSATEVDSGVLLPIRQWAINQEQGWKTLFFAAGILLSSEKRFRWASIGGGLVKASHTAEQRVTSLLTRFAGRGDCLEFS